MNPAELGKLASETLRMISENSIPVAAIMLSIASLGFAIKKSLPSRWTTMKDEGIGEGKSWALQKRTLPVRPVQTRRVIIDNRGRVIEQIGPNYQPRVPENKYTPNVK